MKRLIIFLTIIQMITFSNVNYLKNTKQETLKNKDEANYIIDRNELSKIVETINIVNNVFVGTADTSKNKLYEAALEGIMSSLDDPYSEYLSKEAYKSMNEQIDGEYSGVGMTINKKKGEYIEIESPFIGSPVYKAGLLHGDKIISINGEDVRPLNAIETSKKLRGPKGSKVVIEVIRKDRKEKETITLVRANIKLDNVEYKMLDNGIGYISLLNFGTDTGHEIDKAVDKLKKEGMKKLIFDLRTNPGGSLGEAVDIASLFTDKELMVTLNYKNDVKKVFNRTLRYKGNFPMVVLTNGGSASASEIVTGILKDYGRATIIGEKTYGKGVAQTVLPFTTGDALKITIAKYSTPKNDNIHKHGIEPDIRIPMNGLLAIKGYTNETQDAKDRRKQEIIKIIEKVEGSKKAKEIIAAGDVQLKAAIDFLNGKKVKSIPLEEKKDK